MKDPPSLLSIAGGGELCERIFFIGLSGRCVVVGKKGHLAMKCIQRQVLQEQREHTVTQEGAQEEQTPKQPQPGSSHGCQRGCSNESNS